MTRFPLPLAFLAAAFLAAGCSKVAVDIQVPKETIVQRVEKQFPIEKRNGPITLTISNPEVEFKSTENRVGIGADVRATLQGAPSSAVGHMEFDGTLSYNDGGLAFTDVKMNQFELNGLPGDDSGQLRELMKQALLREIKGMSVYHFHSDDPKEAMVAQSLQDIKVTDDGLTVTLGAGN